MPSKKIKCVYEILVGDFRYIGSSTNFARRKRCHKSRTNSNNKAYNCPIYKCIRENGFCWEDLQFNILEQFEECTKEELLECESKYIRADWENENLLNSNMPGRTKKEFYEDNKKVISAQKKVYREKNKKVISAQKKGYYEKNKEKLMARVKVYREDNKEKLRARAKERILCDCGREYAKADKVRHKHSRFHKDYEYSNRFIFID